VLKKNKKLYLTLGITTIVFLSIALGITGYAEESIEGEFEEMSSDFMVSMKYIGLAGLVIGGYIIYKVQKYK